MKSGPLRRASGELQQIPTVSERIAPDRNGAIGFMPGFFIKDHALDQHDRVIARKVVRGKEQANAAAELIAYDSVLQGPFGFGQNQAALLSAGGRIRTQRLRP